MRTWTQQSVANGHTFVTEPTGLPVPICGCQGRQRLDTESESLPH